MTRLIWDNPSGPKYTSGVSQGVFFGKDGKGVAWSGLVGVTEKPQANAPTPIYNAAGTKYDIKGNVAEKKHALTCYIYPDAMDEYLGIEYLDAYGFKADERAPKPFHMAYRTETGNGHYEIHVLLSQIATFSDTARATLSTNATPSVISMNLEGVPDPRFKSSHVILDSRLPITKSAESLLFGDEFNDSDFNAFLTAEPVWETVAINYAPTIEPDYDNWVWLGGENLVGYSRTPFSPHKEFNTSMFNYNFGDVYHIVRITPTSMPPAGSEIIATVSATLPPGRTTMRLYAQNDSSNEPVATLSPIGGGLYQAKTTMREGEYQWFNLYGAASAPEQNDNPGDVYVEWVKIEMGSTPTPWTPAPSDANQLPTDFDPTPANYKPGVVGGRWWDQRTIPARNAIVFWDEDRKAAGFYSTKTSNTGSPPYLSPNPTSTATTILPKQMDAKFSMEWELVDNFRSDQILNKHSSGTIQLVSPTYTSSKIPTIRGRHKSSVRGVIDGGATGLNYGLIRGVGFIDSPIALMRDLLLTDSSYVGPFFDANSIPATKGDRYVRIPTPNGDATEHQQLRLRTTSNLVLRDITPYQYWIDAADSHLLLQGDTFTVSGPQVTMNGDLFTIDDSITGFSSDAN